MLSAEVGTMNKEEILVTLQKNRKLKTQKEFDNFSIAVQELMKIRPDLDYITNLLTIFLDNAEIIDGMRKLEEYIIFDVDKSIVVEALVNTSSEMLDEAKDWLYTLYVALFASENNLYFFTTAYSNLSKQEKEKLQLIFNLLIDYSLNDADEIKQSFLVNIEYILADNK